MSERVLGRLCQALAWTSLLYLAAVTWIAWRRAFSPFPIEIVEEGVAMMATRAHDGLPIYAKPTLEYAPLLYGPLYPWVCGQLFRWFGESLVVMRCAAMLGTLASFIALFALARRAAGTCAGVLAVGLFCATFPLSEAWFDLARTDLWLLAFVLLAALASQRGQAVGTALLMLAAFFTKQSALLLAPVCAAVLALHGWRRPLVFCATFAFGLGITIAALHLTSDGWSTYFLFTLPGLHGFSDGVFPDLLRTQRMFAAPIALAVLGCVRIGSDGWRKAMPLLATCGGCVVVALLSRMRAGGYDNTLIPAHAALALLAAVGTAHAARGPFGIVAIGLLAAGLAMLVFDPRRFVPKPEQESSMQAVEEVLLRTKGEFLMPSHGFLLRRTGHTPSADGTAAWDLLRSGEKRLTDELLAELQSRIAKGHYRALLLTSGGIPPWESSWRAVYPVRVRAAPEGMPLFLRSGGLYEELWWCLRADDATLPRRKD